MHQIFPSRMAAGRLLAEKLAPWAEQPGLLVLALPRGGVPVAAEVALRFMVPLDVLVVRKLGAPANREVAIGAIATGGQRVLNARALESFGVTPLEVERLVARETVELLRRERIYRRGQPARELRNHPVMLIDDGIATGATMRVAVAALRKAGAGRIVVAAPVAARESYLELREIADEFVTLCMPRAFESVGAFYVDFEQTTDAEVQSLLRQCAREKVSISAAPMVF